MRLAKQARMCQTHLKQSNEGAQIRGDVPLLHVGIQHGSLKGIAIDCPGLQQSIECLQAGLDTCRYQKDSEKGISSR